MMRSVVSYQNSEVNEVLTRERGTVSEYVVLDEGRQYISGTPVSSHCACERLYTR